MTPKEWIGVVCGESDVEKGFCGVAEVNPTDGAPNELATSGVAWALGVSDADFFC